MTLPQLDTGSTRNLILSIEEEDAYYELLNLLGCVAFYETPMHRLLGYSQPVQGGRYAEGGSQRLLLQLDSETWSPDIKNIQWQAAGRGYFWITPTALEQSNFSKVGFVMECT